MKPVPVAAQRGFTLLELSIVLVLIGVILAGALVTFTGSLQASQYNATVTKMDDIEKALLNYAIANNRIPCPTDLTLTTASVNYGMEAGASAGGTATGECVTGMTPAANSKSVSGAEEGGVPTRALQLTDDYMYDGWGRKFRYAVDPTMTKASALPYPAGGLCSASTTAITVNDASGAARTTAGIYALISHGANGHGAYTSNGVVLNAGSVNANEQTNCHCTSGAAAGTYTPTYIETVPTQDPANALDNFDDIVTFKEGWQMQALNYPLAAKLTCQMLAVASDTTPYIFLYQFSGGVLTNLPAPSPAPTVTPGTSGFRSLEFTKDNSHLVMSPWPGYDYTGWVYPVSSAGFGTPTTFSDTTYGVGAKLSPDSAYYAFDGWYLDLYSTTGGTFTQVYTTNPSTPPGAGGSPSEGLTWSPDGSKLYVSGYNGGGGNTLMVYTHSGNSLSFSYGVDYTAAYGMWGSAYLENLGIDPTGTYLAHAIQNQIFVLSNLSSNPPTLLATLSAMSFAPPVWSPDGTMLAIADYYNGLMAWSFNGSSFTAATISGSACLSGGTGTANFVSWSKDGKYLAVSAANSSVPLCLYSRSGSTLTNLNIATPTGFAGNAYGVAFSK
jgi:prepilin-type N-terminal cleavage/methylation domain-containing protein